MYILLFVLPIARLACIYATSPVPVAVCVTGQIGRLLPQFIMKDLIRANQGFYFDIYAFFQGGNLKITTFSTSINSQQSAFAMADVNKLPQLVSNAFNSNNSKLAMLSFIPKKKFSDWQLYMGANFTPNSSIFFDWVSKPHIMESIFNMYAKIAACAESIIQSKIKYEAVILSRDDLYFFQPVDLDLLIKTVLKHCDVIAKDCLNYGGVNMRLQVLSKNRGLQFLRQHLEFAKYLFESNQTVRNPESMELAHANYSSARVCMLPVDLVPTTGPRLENGNICFLKKEIYNCVPESSTIVPNCTDDPLNSRVHLMTRQPTSLSPAQISSQSGFHILSLTGVLLLRVFAFTIVEFLANTTVK